MRALPRIKSRQSLSTQLQIPLTQLLPRAISKRKHLSASIVLQCPKTSLIQNIVPAMTPHLMPPGFNEGMIPEPSQSSVTRLADFIESPRQLSSHEQRDIYAYFEKAFSAIEIDPFFDMLYDDVVASYTNLNSYCHLNRLFPTFLSKCKTNLQQEFISHRFLNLLVRQLYIQNTNLHRLAITAITAISYITQDSSLSIKLIVEHHIQEIGLTTDRSLTMDSLIDLYIWSMLNTQNFQVSRHIWSALLKHPGLPKYQNNFFRLLAIVISKAQFTAGRLVINIIANSWPVRDPKKVPVYLCIVQQLLVKDREFELNTKKKITLCVINEMFSPMAETALVAMGLLECPVFLNFLLTEFCSYFPILMSNLHKSAKHWNELVPPMAQCILNQLKLVQMPKAPSSGWHGSWDHIRLIAADSLYR